MKLDKLYRKRQSGTVSYIQLYTRKVKGQDIYIKYVETGVIGTKKPSVSSVKVTEGKNIGRKNETTVKQQAEKELHSEWKALWSDGYKLDLEYVESTTYNTFKDKSNMPMLLNKYKEAKKDEDFVPGFMQFKKDGVRCFGEEYVGDRRLKSRKGKIFEIQHILDSVSTLRDTQLDQIFDGEIYLHGVPLQDIGSMVKQGDPNQKLEYHIYDIAIPNLTFAQRRNLLLALDVSNIPNIFIDVGVPVSNKEEVAKFHKEAMDKGYEGSVFCHPDSMYNFGFRTNGKSKLKPRVTDEFKCVDHYWNKGKMSKQSTLICINKEGKRFHVKLKGTEKQREFWAANYETEIKDQMITVEYRKLSNDKKPLEAVAIAPRDYE